MAEVTEYLQTLQQNYLRDTGAERRKSV